MTNMNIKTIFRAAALLIATAIATPAFAGGVTIAKNDESKLKLEAKIFLNTTDYHKEVNGVQTVHTRTASLDRAYLGIKYYFDKDWMMRITYDVNNEVGLGKSQQVFLKYAYLEGKLAGDALVLRLGQSHTPWIDYEQGLWKHRYVSKVMTDTNKLDSSSELGVGLKGKVNIFHYFVTATDGYSYSSAKNFKNGGTGIDFNGRVGVEPIEGLTLDVQYINGFNGTQTSTATGTKQTFYQAMATYGSGHDYRIGVNYLNNKEVTVATNLTSKKADGFDVWGWAKISSNFGAFARYESLKDKLSAASPEKKLRTVVGLEYSPRKHINLSLAYDNLKVTNLGNVANKTERVRRYGLYSQFKF